MAILHKYRDLPEPCRARLRKEIESLGATVVGYSEEGVLVSLTGMDADTFLTAMKVSGFELVGDESIGVGEFTHYTQHPICY